MRLLHHVTCCRGDGMGEEGAEAGERAQSARRIPPVYGASRGGEGPLQLFLQMRSRMAAMGVGPAAECVPADPWNQPALPSGV